MFLEEWIKATIQQRLKEPPDAQKSLNKLNRDYLEKYQLLKLKETLDYVCQQSSFYQKLFDKAKIKPSDIQSLRDLDKIPFTKQSDLAESPYKFLCVSLGAVGRMYTLNTGGTTGNPKRIFFSEKDLEEITDYMGAAIKTVAIFGGISKDGYKVAILLPDGEPASQANLLARGIGKHGGVPIKIDVSLDNQSQFDIIKEIRPNIVFGSVFRLWRLTQETRLSHDLTSIGVNILFLTSEYLPEAMRGELKNAWGGDVYCHYGMTEMGFGGCIECASHDGYHFNEADFLFEAVDPITGRALEPGHQGELVFTSLHREGMPFVRYRTGDLSNLIPIPCRCGAQVIQRIGKVNKKIASIVRLTNGDEIFPSMFADVLFTIPEVTDYQTIIYEEDSKDSLLFKVETTIEVAGIEQMLINKILTVPAVDKNIKSGTMTVPRVELVKQGQLKRQGRAKKLIADER